MRAHRNGPSTLHLPSGPIVILAACTVLAGLGLAWVTTRGVLQERTIAEQDVRDATAAAARRTADDVVAELRRWERDVPRAAWDADGAISVMPSSDVRRALESDTALIAWQGGRIRTWPRGQALFEPSDAAPPATPVVLPPAVQVAESLELRTRNLDGAIAAYRALLGGTAHGSVVRVAVQQRLARSLRKAGRPRDALEVLEALIRDNPANSAPDMAAAWYDRCALARENLSWRGFPDDANNLSGRGYSPEACAAALYEGLVDGRWRLEAPLYEFYAAQARSWLQPVMGRADIAELARREARKLALTNAAIAALRQWRATNPAGDEGHLVVGASPAPVLAVWRRFNGDGGGDDMSMLVLGPATLATRVWQPLVARSAPGYAVSIAANRLGLLTSTAADADAAPDAANASAGPEVHGASAHTDVATLTVEDGGIVWRVTARADAAHDPRQAVAVRTRLYLGTLAVMLVAVALAGYLAIRTVRRELEVARLKSEFVSAVSHEFRSPLAAISHLSELLDAGRVPDDERRREYYGLIVNETARLRRLVENLLDFARLEEGRAEFQFDAMDVEPWLRDAVNEFQASRAAAGMQVETAVHEGLPAVRADAEALTTVVVNLLDNAVKYSPGCERVWVEAGPAHGGAEIRVRDAGPGIPEDEQPHVFDRFFRGRDAGAVSGTGLGLALVARTVEAHGGRVSVESRLGEGSTFVVWLPAWREEQA